ncbi:MAG: RimK family alpha-L-glutamate ligase [Sulfolobales archaeon]|nr:RimK family alpha-L-glutamate ligase [Sulfolobales archaeon]MCX8185508.1 RimK family alpha-L-glutamate ligase [Sulfolobales archaeon]MDW7970013.1 RimK family alpha-L-glutamate ligase [Sulfolobales archaeon]
MRVGIIHDSPVPTLSSRQLMLAFMKRGVESFYVRISKLASVIDEQGIKVMYGSEVSDFMDSLLIRSLGFIATLEQVFRRADIIRQLELSGTLIINPIESMLKARDKYASILALKAAGVNVPPTAVVEEVFTAVDICRKWGDVVIKPMMGSMGYGAVRTSDPDLVFTIAKTWLIHGQPVYIQKYIPKPGRDIRVFVVGDEVLGGYYRYAPDGSWKTNIAQGARAEKIERLSEELVNMSLKAVNTLKLHYAGVDIGETDGGFVIFEVNAAPQWSGFMSATGINPSEKIADYIIKLLKN